MIRRSKLLPLDEAASLVEPGMTLALGGFWYHNQPCAFARALVRQGATALRLTGSPVGGYGHDLLLGAEAVDRLMQPHISFDELGLAPNVRRRIEAGTVVVEEVEEGSLLGALRATAQGRPSVPVDSLEALEISAISPLVSRTAGGMHAVAFEPDVAVIHVAYADEFGNGVHHLSPFADRMLARTGRTVIVTAERIVSNAEIRAQPARTTILSMWVDAVVEAPFGAHPGSCHGEYAEDVDELRRYIAAAERARRGDDFDYAAYLDAYVRCTAEDYVRRFSP